MTTAGAIDIPNSLDEVTPAWLSAALGQAFPGVEVASISREPLHLGTASTWRLGLDYAPGRPAGPKTLAIKSDLGLEHAKRLAQVGLYRKEALVYLEVLPAAAARVAGCYAAAYESSGRGFMLLEDLSVAGATFLHPTSGLTVAQVRTGVEQLARLHASTWDKPWLREPDWMHHGAPLSVEDRFWDVVFDRWADGIQHPHAGAISRLFKDLPVVRRAFNRLRIYQDAAAHSLIHGDAHVGNFYADRNGDVGMADFQCVQRGDVAHDLTTFMVSSLDIVDRRENERALLRYYLDFLKGLGVAAPPAFEDLWIGYRRHLVYSIVTWMFTTASAQPELDLVTNMSRFGTAALDLDTLSLFD
jgi:aminoglycoside phosphotransferase (APT) family kinase protein